MGRCLRIELPDGGWADVDVDEGIASTLAAAAGVAPDDPWVEAVVAALEREPRWRSSYGTLSLRAELTVQLGAADMFHVSSRKNRASIEAHGLDWNRMGDAPGIAGSRRPEAPAIFLNDDRWNADWFVTMGTTDSFGRTHVAVDIWAVDATGIWIENGPDGWWMAFQPLEPDRVRLVED
jgi:hypothetical protein